MLNSSAHAIASSVGSISVVPLRTWSQTASAVAAGAWPVMAPVSPRQQIDVLDPVDVGEARAGRLGDEDRERARPLDHPVHRHAGQQRAPGALVERLRARVKRDEPLLLARLQPAQPVAVDGPAAHRR